MRASIAASGSCPSPHPSPRMSMSLNIILNRGIQDLALELIQEIVYHSATSTRSDIGFIYRPTLFGIRLVCRSFRFAADPVLFAVIRLNFSWSEGVCYFNASRYVQTLIEGTNPFCRFAKTLRIDYMYRNLHSLVANPDFTEGAIADLVKQAIISLKNIRVVHYNLHIAGFTHFIIDGLAELVHLEEICLEYMEGPWLESRVPNAPISLLHLRNVRRISLKGIDLSLAHATEYMHQIHNMMKNGVSLTSMALTLPTGMSYIDYQRLPQNILHDIFHNVPCTPKPGLRHLLLSGYNLKPDVFTWPHLGGLTSLDISHENGFPDGEFWSTMQAASIRLNNLVIEKVTEPVLWYLDSYLGLEVLSVVGAGLCTSRFQGTKKLELVQEAQRVSHELCSTTLPRHKDSLVSYNGHNRLIFRPPSYMTYDTMLALSSCKNLENLAFALHISDLDLEDKKMLNDSTQILEMALALPHIRHIEMVNSVEIVPRRRSRNYRGNINYEKIKETGNKILTAVRLSHWQFSGGRDSVEQLCEVHFNGVPYSPYIRQDGFVSLKLHSPGNRLWTLE